MREIILNSPIQKDAYTQEIESLFGLAIGDHSEVIIKDNIEPPLVWNVGLIYGPSGSGKSTLLKRWGEPITHIWNDRAVISNFTEVSPKEATELLTAVGFSNVPAWLRPFHALSVGEQFRANLARTLSIKKDVYVIDEFTSTLDRNVARSASNLLAKYLRRTNGKAVLASPHSDILEWLLPDWYYNPSEGETRTGSDSLQRPSISLEIIRCSQTAWPVFQQHHYLDISLSKGTRCFLALWEGTPVGFSASLSLPHATIGYAWRESRTVVLPDYQGLNIGVRLSDYIASMAKATGCRFYSKTVHPAMVAYRLRSPNWRETDGSGKSRTASKSMIERNWKTTNRRCYSFEYIGPASSDEEAKLFWDDSTYAQRKKKKKYAQGLIIKGQGDY